MNKREARAQAKALAKERKKLTRDMAARHLGELRGHLKEARKLRASKLVEARSRCKADRLAARERIKAWRRAELASLRRQASDMRAAQVNACHIRHAQALAEARGAEDAAVRELEAERAHRREIRRIEAAHKQRQAEIGRQRKAIERVTESDDAVRGNIPPDLVPLFERVKGRIRGGERMSRTEAFLHYAHEHPDEVIAIIEADVDRTIAELEKKEKAARKTLKKARAGKPLTEAELAGPWDMGAAS